MAKGSELATTGSDFIVARERINVAEILSTNLADSGFNPNDLDAVRIPAGGILSWSVPSLDGEEMAKSVSAVIVGVQAVRAWWLKSLDEGSGNQPPDCSSPDAKIGFGDPLQTGKSGYYECALCPNAEFGSSPKGGGQWCKEMRQVFILRPDDLLPIRLVLPPTSIKPFSRYLLRLSSYNRPYFAVVTRFTLTKTQSQGGIAYSQAAFERDRDLSEDEVATFRGYALSFSDFLSSTKQPIKTSDDYVYRGE